MKKSTIKRERNFCGVATSIVVVLVALGVGNKLLEKDAVARGQDGRQAPTFQVDPMWPKPLPNHWILGAVIGVSVDSKDHVWIVHRPSTILPGEKGLLTHPATPDRDGKIIAAEDSSRGVLSEWCCAPAPPVLEFDQAGNLLRHWGGAGPGYDWPKSEHGIFIDYKDHVWLGGNGTGGGRDAFDRSAWDAQILKFTQDGKFLLQIGHKGKSGGSNDPENLGRPSYIRVDPTTNEVYVSDGYGNHRVIVFDADTGAYKRHWGAYGKKPDDNDPDILGETPGNTRYDPNASPIKQFRTVHGIAISKDGFVYVVDRPNCRIQVFKKDGTFVKEAFVAKKTLRSGSLWDVGLSKDPQEAFVYLPDGENQRVYILRRDTLQVVRTFGDGGRYPGLFYGPHSLAVDSKGNIYTGETFEGKRVQRFLYKGMGPTTSQ